MNILAFNTSTEKFSLAVFKKNKIVYLYSKILKKNYSKYLISIIKDSLKKSKTKIEEINTISVSLGPGSFTGIRLGIAAAKGLALPNKVNIFGFSNMDLIINSLNEIKENKILLLIKSKKNDYYYQIFNNKRKPLTKISYFSDFIIPRFKKNEKILVVGYFDKNLKNKIKLKNKNKISFIEKDYFNARNLINLLKLSKNMKKRIEPIYVYDHYAKK